MGSNSLLSLFLGFLYTSFQRHSTEMLFNLIGPRFVEQKGLNSNERSFVWARGEAFVFLF